MGLGRAGGGRVRRALRVRGEAARTWGLPLGGRVARVAGGVMGVCTRGGGLGSATGAAHVRARRLPSLEKERERFRSWGVLFSGLLAIEKFRILPVF